MFDKRLFSIAPGVGRLVAGKIACLWASLIANIVFVAGLVALLGDVLAALDPHAAAAFCGASTATATAASSCPDPLAALPAAIGDGLTPARIGVYALVFAACAAVRYAAARIGAGLGTEAAERVKLALRDALYGKMLRLGPSYANRVKTSDVVQSAGEGIEQVQTFFELFLPQLVYAVLAPVTLFAVIAPLDLPTAATLLVCAPLIVIIVGLVAMSAARMFKRYWGTYTDLGAAFLDDLQGLETLTIFDADARAARRMDEQAERFRIMTMRVLQIQLRSLSAMDLVAYGGTAAGIGMALWRYFAAGDAVSGGAGASGAPSLAAVVLIVLLSADFFIPLRQLGSYFHVAMNGMTSTKRIFALLDAPEPARGTDDHTFAAAPAVAFDHVTYDYRRAGDAADAGDAAGADDAADAVDAVDSSDSAGMTDAGAPSVAGSADASASADSAVAGASADTPAGAPADADASASAARPALADATFTARPGEVTAIVGVSGSGKSTAAALLAGTLTGYRGSITLHDGPITAGASAADAAADVVAGTATTSSLPALAVPTDADPASATSATAHELRDLTGDALARTVTLVGARSHLFAGTLRDNLMLALPDSTVTSTDAAESSATVMSEAVYAGHSASTVADSVASATASAAASATAADARLWDALERARVADFVRAHPDGLDLRIDPDAANLSGGQRQRIAIARALLHDSPVLVFDEATSSVDVDSETRILATIRDLAAAGKTVVMITHRMANAADADHVAVFARGRIVETGTPAALLAADGTYARLLRTQQAIESVGRATRPRIDDLRADTAAVIAAIADGTATTVDGTAPAGTSSTAIIGDQRTAASADGSASDDSASAAQNGSAGSDETAIAGRAGTSAAAISDGRTTASSADHSDDHATDRGSTLPVIMRLLGEARPLAHLMTAASVAGTIGHIAATMLPAFGVIALLALAGHPVWGMGAAPAVIAMTVCAILRGALRYVEQYLNHNVAFRLLALFRSKAFAALRRLAPARLTGHGKGDLIALITTDVELLEIFFAHTISPVAIALATSITYAVLLATLDLTLALALIAAHLVIGVIVPRFFATSVHGLGPTIRRQSSALDDRMLDDMRGLREIIGFGRGRERAADITRRTRDLWAEHARLSRVNGGFAGIGMVLVMILTIGATALAVWRAALDPTAAGRLAVAVVLFASSFGPTLALSALPSNLTQTFAAARRLFALMDETPAVTERGTATPDYDGMTLDHVTFRYPTAGERGSAAAVASAAAAGTAGTGGTAATAAWTGDGRIGDGVASDDPVIVSPTGSGFAQTSFRAAADTGNIGDTETSDSCSGIPNPMPSDAAKADDTAPILDDVSLDIPRHGILGVQGPSGRGKSTTLKLLMRYWDPQSGTVSLSGTPLGDVDVHHRRRIQTMMSQETALFDGTIRDNLLIAIPDDERADAGDAASESAGAGGAVAGIKSAAAHRRTESAIVSDSSPASGSTASSLQTVVAAPAASATFAESSESSSSTASAVAGAASLDERLLDACRKASVLDLIESLPDGLDTRVGELGDRLSEGERQRIGLARIFLRRADLVLFDEPTSRLDALNEAVILQSITALAADGTAVVLVSHRESAMRIADRIVRM
ncbi:ATP-binding cassette domain-containing protein [Bifidobacterium samirii]|uniref:ABC transporter ATP-binding protein n=1 Tax=Bifidobacterium samirii TaxID=2306974 RepID=A0A430FR69_9BIFI|nr:ATP-binding cassette domain-containing protein [Bifidobacterium samirii]RSX55330.1 ABC transporter ATP-binding protein [Bifidobacterium samirii]